MLGTTFQFHYQESRYGAKHCNIDVEKIVILDSEQNTYLIPGETIPQKFYEGNIQDYASAHRACLEDCANISMNWLKNVNVLSTDIVPGKDPRMRAYYHFLATGEKKDANRYRYLFEQQEVEGISQFIEVFDFMNPSADEEVAGAAADRNIVENDELQNKESETTDFDDAHNNDDNIHDNDDNIQDYDRVKNNFLIAIEAFSEEVVKRLENDFHYYEKSVTLFTKGTQNVENIRAEAFKKALPSFGSENPSSTRKGRKKTMRLIHVQDTSKSWRLYKARVRTGSRKGPT